MASKEDMEEKIKNMSPEELKQFQIQNCIFCQISKGAVASKKIYEDEKCIAILDINPANPGHVLLMPKEHYTIMPLVPEDSIKHLFMVTKQISGALLKSLKAEGINVFIANGAAAGQKAQHFMIHIIPRVEKDDVGLELKEKEIDEKSTEDIRKKLSEAVAKAFNFKIEEEKSPDEKSKKAEESDEKEELAEDTEEKEIFVNDKEFKINKEKGYLYFIDKNGDVSRTKMARGRKNSGKREIVAKVGLKREKGFLYFISKDGRIAFAKMARGRKKGVKIKKILKARFKKSTKKNSNKRILDAKFKEVKTKTPKISKEEDVNLDDIANLITGKK